MKRLSRILLEKDAQDYEATRTVLARLPGVPVTVIPDRDSLRPLSAERAVWLSEAKSTLFLAVQKGPFRRPCPGTKNYLCCGYQVLQVAVGCPMDCTYCVLQGYVNVPAITLFVNVEDLLAELDSGWAENPGMTWRLGTGEFGDSLALDGLLGLNQRLIPWVARHPRALLEIKTKRADIENLLPLGPNSQVVFAWSLNPEEVVLREEKFTASLPARLAAASRTVAAGFRVAFHFDPLLYFPGWEEAYRRTVAAMGEAVPARAVAWISLGGLRFPPPLRSTIMRRFPQSSLAAQEMVWAPDGKLRYFKGRRVEMYGRLRGYLSEAVPGALVYLCMESPRIWREVFGFTPEGDDLTRMLDARVEGAQKAGSEIT